MRFILATIGSRGHTLPFFSIGARLKSQGHRVTVIAEHGYADQAALAGVEYVSLYSEAEAADVARDRWLLHSRRYDLLFLRRHMVGWNRTILNTIRVALEDGDRVTVVSNDRNVVWGDLWANQRYGVKVVRAAVDLPKLPGPKSQATPVQNRLLAEADAQWGGDIFGQYRQIRPRAKSMALYPSWLAPEFDGFTFGFMPVLEKPGIFISFSDLVFTSGTDGSLAGWMDRFAAVSSQACFDLGMRGALLGGGVYAPLPMVLATAKAFVHHGGIGTIAAALESGVPQLVIPRVSGQFANAERLRRLGLCRVLNPYEWTTAGAAPALRTVMSDFCKDAARRARGLVDREASLSEVCKYLTGTNGR